MILKLTGRYYLEKPEFIELIEQNPDADAVVRAWAPDDVYTGAFAMRYNYLIHLLSNIDYNDMAKRELAIEWKVGAYVTAMKNNGSKIVYLPRVYDYLTVCPPTGFTR